MTRKGVLIWGQESVTSDTMNPFDSRYNVV
jgi:hypothetical protein